MQKGMLFESLSAPESGAYLQQLICMLRGDLDIHAFQDAWQQIVQRHSVLRTSFTWEHDEEPVQRVSLSQTEVPFKFQDWKGIAASEQEQQFQTLLMTDRARGFTLSESPLVRLTDAAANCARSLQIAIHFSPSDSGWMVPAAIVQRSICNLRKASPWHESLFAVRSSL